jgi:drug/metabolite transporter (DMT)-like permease
MTTNRYRWVPYAAIVGGALLLVESALVIGSEDTLADGPMVALFDVGHLLALAAAIGFGLQQRRGRRTVVAVGLSVALVAYVIALSEIVGKVFEAMSDAPWVQDEGPIGVLGVVLLALGALGQRSRDTRVSDGVA